MRKFFLSFALIGLFLSVSISAHAVLIDRGSGLIYDADLDITWLQDANYAQTSGVDADGYMDWDTAMAWAANLTYGGFDDWRLPTAFNSDGSGPCLGYECTGSEMGHLYSIELGNLTYVGVTNTGPFINLQPEYYWFGTEYEPIPAIAWDFRFGYGEQGADAKNTVNIYAWAVRDGDVAAVPEPAGLLLLGSGLAGMGWWRRKGGYRSGANGF